MNRGHLAIHGHFYQPARDDPFTGRSAPEPDAGPREGWNARIAAECYAPNAESGNFGRIGFDLGPTLATWLRREMPVTHDAIARQGAGPNVMAQAFHHTILPLAPARDRRTEIRWGLRDAELRFGHRPLGIWLPETAVDVLTLRIAADEGVRYTILAPWQAATSGLDTRRLYRVELGGDRHIVVAFYEGGLSASVSFESGATSDAHRFATDRLAPVLAEPLPDGSPAMALIATDGELYGHHKSFRELFLASLTGPTGVHRDFEVTTIGALVADEHRPHLPLMAIRDQTSWSCHHGVLRWSGECPDAADGRWKRPLRSAFDRLAAAIDTITEREAAEIGVDLWSARDAWADVAAEFATGEEVVGRILADALHLAPARAARMAADRSSSGRLETILRAQRSRMAMFASDAWYWDDPSRQETTQALRWAAHAARLVDVLSHTHLEATLVDDLAALRSPAAGLDGAALYAAALRAIDQPVRMA